MAIIPELYPEFDENTVYKLDDVVISESHDDGNLWHCVIDNIQGTWNEVQALEDAKGNRGGFAVGGLTNVS